ncbi:glycosyltransferase [Candidatus Pacearchaeota archaeon]|nr:glycosyltransferase [Candidatus Pacearchaeota archaeon]
MTKRILLIGPLIANAGHGAESGIYDALVDLGHKVFCYDPRADQVVSRHAGAFFKSFASFVRKMPSWDLILCPGPGIPHKLHESGLLNSLEGKKVLWNSEPIRLEHYRERIVNQSYLFDLICTFDESEIPLYQNLGCENVMFLPQAFNPKWYKPKHSNPTNDFVFVGSIGGKWKNREPFLRMVNSICQRNKWSLNVKQTFNANVVNDLYNDSKVVLNLGLYHPETGAPSDLKAFALQQRIFEAIGAGRVTLTHDLGADTNQILIPCQDVVCYDGSENLEWAMQYALTHWDDFSDNILKVRDNHNYKARMETLVEVCSL